MKILLQQARYHGPLPAHLRSKAPKGERADFLIEEGVLTKVGSGLKAPGALVIQSKDLHLSRGLTDLYADFGTPVMKTVKPWKVEAWRPWPEVLPGFCCSPTPDLSSKAEGR